jgi:UDP-glucose 4-epimerase
VTRFRVLITGGAGFIGSHLAERLLHSGDAVTVLDDLSTGCPANLGAIERHPRFRFVEGTVVDARALEPLVRDSDLLFHLAAAVGVELVLQDIVRTIETNVVGTLEMLRSAQRHGTRVLITSSSEIYGKSRHTPLVEDGDRLLGATTSLRWGYSTSKAADEYLALGYFRQHGLRVTIARLFNTIGPRQIGRYGMVVPRLVAQALSGEDLTVYGDGGQTRSFCDVLDTVEALEALAIHPGTAGEVFNVGSDREISIQDLARRILMLVDGPRASVDRRIRLVPYQEAYGPGFEDMPRRVPDLTKIRRLLTWQPRRLLDETLERIIAAQ